MSRDWIVGDAILMACKMSTLPPVSGVISVELWLSRPRRLMIIVQSLIRLPFGHLNCRSLPHRHQETSQLRRPINFPQTPLDGDSFENLSWVFWAVSLALHVRITERCARSYNNLRSSTRFWQGDYSSGGARSVANVHFQQQVSGWLHKDIRVANLILNGKSKARLYLISSDFPLRNDAKD